MIITNWVLCISLAIYHPITNARSWNKFIQCNHLGEGSAEKDIILMVTDVQQPALAVDCVTVDNLRNPDYLFSYPRQQLHQC